MQDHWAPKSAKDDEDPAVVRAKRWHLVLWDVIVCGLYMAVFGWLGGESGSAAWLILCRYPLGVSAQHARAALDGSVVLSFVVRPLHARLYAR